SHLNILEKALKFNYHSLEADYSLNFFCIFFTQNYSYLFFPFLILLFVVRLNSLSKFYQIPIFFFFFYFIYFITFFSFFFIIFYYSFIFFLFLFFYSCFLFFVIFFS